MNSEFNGDNAYEHLRFLAQDIGPRAAGSAEERKAAEYIASCFRGFGLEVRTQSFPVVVHEQIRTELHAMGAEDLRVNCAAQQFAADTPEEGVEGDLVFLETAHPQYLDEGCRGKIWLILDGLPMSAYRMAMGLEPKAIVAVESQMGVLPKRTHLRRMYRDRFGSVPTVRISFEDGMRLIKTGVQRVRIFTKGREKQTESVNVVGEIPGRKEHSEIVVICAHLDSVRHVAGAGDNASGTAILTELARAFTVHGTKRTLRFIGFGSEEIGLRGSKHYAGTLWDADRAARETAGFNDVLDATELSEHVMCINLDMHGVILGSNVATAMGPPDLAAAVRLLSSEIGPAFGSITEGTFSSDGMCLAAVGVPGAAFARVGGSSIVTHSRADTIEYLDAGHLSMMGRFIEAFVKRYAADAFAFPFAREIPGPIQEEIRRYFNRSGEPFPPQKKA